MRIVPYFLAACFAAMLFVIVYLSGRQRTAAIRTLAARSGFHYLGEALPKSLTLFGTPFARFSKVWNVIDGEPHGVRIIAFDCQVGIGKRSWTRSVIAVESKGDLRSALALNPDIRVDSTRAWKILYRPKGSFNMRIVGLTPVEELQAYLTSISAPKKELNE
jgi:hypothetical protein